MSDYKFAIIKYEHESTTCYQIVRSNELMEQLIENEMRYSILNTGPNNVASTINCTVVMRSDNKTALGEVVSGIVSHNWTNSNPENIRYVLAPETIELSSEDEEQEEEVDSQLLNFRANLAKVSAEHLNNIDWNKTRRATNTLLSLMFTSQTLATHTLTGRTETKLRLDPMTIDYIVTTVSENTGDSERSVLTIIRNRCRSERKKLRTFLGKAKLLKKLFLRQAIPASEDISP